MDRHIQDRRILGAVFCVAILVSGMLRGWPAFEVAIEDHKFSLGDFGGSIIVFLGGIYLWDIHQLQNFGIDQTIYNDIWFLPLIPMSKNLPFTEGCCTRSYRLFSLFIGTALYAYYKVNSSLPEGLVNAPDKVFPHFIVNELPGVSGLLIASIFAAGMSSISTSFNSTSTVLLTDYFKKMSVKIINFGFNGSTVVICLTHFDRMGHD